jgi:ABC-2 type transport system permease protein
MSANTANGSVLFGSVFAKSLWDQRKAILGWGVGLAGLAYITLLAFPSIGSNPEFDQLFKQVPQLQGFLGDVAAFDTIEGFVTSQFLAFMPVILTVYVVMAAAGTITGEIESGTMDYLLAHPLPRWRVALEKYLALLAALVLICLIIGLGMWLGGVTIGQNVSFGTWMLAGIDIAPLTLLYGSIAFALACALRGRGIPIGVAVALSVGGFILNGLAPLVENLQRYREWTIYYLFAASKPFSSGLDVAYTSILLAGSAAFLILGVGAFLRRDILA